MHTTEANRAYYRQVSAKTWDRHRDIAAGARVLQKLEFLLQPLLLDANSHWLDIGCGKGESAFVAQRLGAHYHGIDLALGSAMPPFGEFREGDFLDLAFSQKFQLISFFSSLHHFHDWRAAVEKARSLLAPGGVLVVEQEPTRLWAWLYAAWLRLWPKKYEQLYHLEKHWLQEPAILPSQLPAGVTSYHWDFFPLLRALPFSWSTQNNSLGLFFPHYRKIIYKETESRS